MEFFDLSEAAQAKKYFSSVFFFLILLVSFPLLWLQIDLNLFSDMLSNAIGNQRLEETLFTL